MDFFTWRLCRLANLFNAIPRTSPARLVVCEALLKLTAENDELDILQLSPADVDRWLGEWGVSAETKSEFYKNIAEIFSKANRPWVTSPVSLFSQRKINPDDFRPWFLKRNRLRLFCFLCSLPVVFCSGRTCQLAAHCDGSPTADSVKFRFFV